MTRCIAYSISKIFSIIILETFRQIPSLPRLRKFKMDYKHQEEWKQPKEVTGNMLFQWEPLYREKLKLFLRAVTTAEEFLDMVTKVYVQESNVGKANFISVLFVLKLYGSKADIVCVRLAGFIAEQMYSCIFQTDWDKASSVLKLKIGAPPDSTYDQNASSSISHLLINEVIGLYHSGYIEYKNQLVNDDTMRHLSSIARWHLHGKAKSLKMCVKKASNWKNYLFVTADIQEKDIGTCFSAFVTGCCSLSCAGSFVHQFNGQVQDATNNSGPVVRVSYYFTMRNLA